MKKFYFVLIIVVLLNNIFSQNGIKPQITWTGFIKTDFFYDTRQSIPTLAIREGHFYLFPDSIIYDNDSVDINEKDAFHILSIQTRLRANITGPNFFKAKTSGVIESEFFGTSETDLNGFRMRHAYVHLKWPKTEMLIGQFWHPMFPFYAIPGTISFNTGTPFIPFSRNPQLKLSQTILPILSINFSVYSERDFASNGPDGPSSKYFRNAALPGLNAELFLKADSINFSMNVGVNYHTIVPELKTAKNYFTNQSIEFLSFYGYFQKKFNRFILKAGTSYLQNGHNVMMLGGYAVSEITDTARNYKKYTPYNTLTGWTDLQFNLNKWQIGFYGGYSKNLGTTDSISGKRYARGINVDYLYRLSPRLSYVFEKLSFSYEVELTTAAYGIAQLNGMVQKKYEVKNTRFLFAVIYNF